MSATNLGGRAVIQRLGRGYRNKFQIDINRMPLICPGKTAIVGRDESLFVVCGHDLVQHRACQPVVGFGDHVVNRGSSIFIHSKPRGLGVVAQHKAQKLAGLF